MESQSPTEAFGRVVRVLREERHLSQERLAGMAGLHRNTLRLIERGTNGATISSIFAIAGALDLSPAELMRRVSDQIAGAPDGQP